MFENYKNIPPTYTPCNIDCCNPITESDKRKARKPLEVYDSLGNCIGFSWNYGDSIVLEFDTVGTVTYDNGTYEDAETYFNSTTKGNSPETTPESLVDPVSSIAQYSGIPAPTPAVEENPIVGKVFNIKLYNYRYEVIYEANIRAEATAKLYIGKKLSMQLEPNVYYGSVTLVDNINDIQQTLLDYNSFRFYVKQN